MRGNNRDKSDRPSSRSGSGFGSGYGGFAPREMHKAKCSECGKECEVPFVPVPGKPVYCRDCFQSKRRR